MTDLTEDLAVLRESSDVLLQQLTGAEVYVMHGDDDVIRSGGAGKSSSKDRGKPAPVARVLRTETR